VRKWLPLIILASAQFIMVLDSSVMNVSISQIVADLNTTVTGVQSAITMYTLVMAAFMLVGAKLGDIYGRRLLYMVAISIFLVGSALCGLAQSMTQLVEARIVQGMGAGGLFALTAKTYAEGASMFPEAGGSSSFARHAFNELASFFAGWALTLDYIITIAISAFFVPHYLSIFWEPLKTNPWDIIGGAAVILILVAINIVGIKEAAGLNVFLAVADFALGH